MIVLLVLITMSGELPVEMLCYGLLDEWIFWLEVCGVVFAARFWHELAKSVALPNIWIG
jgi:hypothetical protein